jgi:hypothetical protein
MRSTAILLFSALSLASVAACAPLSGDQRTARAATCPRLEGYPDCPSQTIAGTVAVAAAPSAGR